MCFSLHGTHQRASATHSYGAFHIHSTNHCIDSLLHPLAAAPGLQPPNRLHSTESLPAHQTAHQHTPALYRAKNRQLPSMSLHLTLTAAVALRCAIAVLVPALLGTPGTRSVRSVPLQVALARPHHNEAQGPGGMGPGGRGSGRGYPGGYSSYGGRGGRGDYGGGRGGYGYDDGYGYSGGGGRGGYNRGYYEEEYYEDDYYGEGSGYGSGGSGGYGGGYGRSAAAAAAPAATTTAATVMVPVQLPSGQVGYMVVPAAGAAAAAATAGGSGGPVRRAATGYGPAYSSGSSYGRGSSSYGAGGGGGSYRPY